MNEEALNCIAYRQVSIATASSQSMNNFAVVENGRRMNGKQKNRRL